MLKDPAFNKVADDQEAHRCHPPENLLLDDRLFVHGLKDP